MEGQETYRGSSPIPPSKWRNTAIALLIVGIVVGCVIGYGSTVGQISSLQTQIQNLQTQVSGLQADKTALQGQVSSLGNEKTQLQIRVTSLESNNTKLQAQVASLQNQIISLESQIQGLLQSAYVISYFPSPGTYQDAQNVSINTAQIVYSLDGSDPNINSTKYTKAIEILKGGMNIIKARAVVGGLLSAVVNAVYNIIYEGAPLGERASHYVFWDFGRSDFHCIDITIKIYDEPSFKDGLYFQMYQGIINGVGFYFGLQTDVQGKGKGLIFSRWGTRDLSNASTVEGGWSVSSGSEGDFIGIRIHYEWATHTYKLRIAYNGTDDKGDWYGVWIFDEDENKGAFMGSMRFPKGAGIQNGGITWTELYYKYIQETPLPTWHVSILCIRADELPPIHATSAYSEGSSNTDIYYDSSTGEIHFFMGYKVKREHVAGKLF